MEKTKKHKIIQSKSTQKKCPVLTKLFESHFNPGHTKDTRTNGKQTNIHLIINSSSSNINNNEPNYDEIKKAINNDNKASFVFELLKTAYLFNNKFLNFMNED